MIICLSSGATERYRQDVLRALALPIGAKLQFRYDTKWISVKTMKKIKETSLVGEDLIIAYLDQSKPEASTDGQHVEVIPVRMGKVSDVAVTGDTVELELTIGTLAHAVDLTAFNAEVENLAEGALPKWKQKKAQGKFCTGLTSEPSNLAKSHGLGQWQETVKQLAARDEFKQEGAFITVLGLPSAKEYREAGVELAHVDWKQKVAPSSSSELLVYHFHPQVLPAGLTLSATVGESLALVSSPTVSVDSRYDLKRFHVRSLDPPTDQGSWIKVALIKGEDDVQLDVEMATIVRSDFLRRLVTGLVIASGLAVAQVMAISVGSQEREVKAVLIAFVLLGSLVVGLAAAFGLRRSY